MQVLHRCCCGLDVHKRFVVACLIRYSQDGTPHKELQRFPTFTPDLLRLIDWLQAAGCTHVALESTGVFTPPTILPMVGGTVKREWNWHGTYTEGDTDLLLIDLDPFDQSTNDVPADREIRPLQLILHLSSKGLQTRLAIRRSSSSISDASVRCWSCSSRCSSRSRMRVTLGSNSCLSIRPSA